MRQLTKIKKRRQEILDEIISIESLRKGVINEQFLKVRHKGKSKPVRRGPYYVLSRNVKGKTKSIRIKKTEVEQVRGDIAAYHRFQKLCDEYAELTELLGDLLRKQAESKDDIKKKRKSNSKKIRK